MRLRCLTVFFRAPCNSGTEFSACRILNPTNLSCGIRESWSLESGIQLRKSGISLTIEIWNPKCGIQNSSLSWNYLFFFYMERYFLRSFRISRSKNFNDGFFSVSNQNSGRLYLPLIHLSGGFPICSHVGLFQFCLIVKKSK